MTRAKREQMVLEHLPLAKFILQQISPNLPMHVDRDDLLEAGVVGLLDAAHRYDPGRKVQFRTFAAPRIRGAILDALRSADWLPRSARSELDRVGAARSELEQKNGRRPTDAELSQKLRMRPRKLNRLHRASQNSAFVSFDELPQDTVECGALPMHGKRDLSLHPAERAIMEETKEQLAAALMELPERERLVISMYYYERLQLHDIARVLKVTDSRVCQIHRAALQRLQELIGEPEALAAIA